MLFQHALDIQLSVYKSANKFEFYTRPVEEVVDVFSQGFMHEVAQRFDDLQRVQIHPRHIIWIVATKQYSQV